MTPAGRVCVPLTLCIAIDTFIVVYGISRVDKFLLWLNAESLETVEFAEYGLEAIGSGAFENTG